MKRKKICVISSYAYIAENINYGALLQYYALQKVLEKEGFDVYWLRYRFPPSKKTLKDRFRFLKHWTKNRKFYHTQKRIMDFVDTNLKLSPKIYFSDTELEEHLPEADIYLTGSDQVWGGTLKANYLCFVPERSKKISYAASFGKGSISEEQKEIIKPWLKRFQGITVREKTGISICADMGITAKQVLDPTLLLMKEDYPTIQTEDKNKYTFCYFLNVKDRNDVPIDAIKQYCVQQNMALHITGGVAGVNHIVPGEEQLFLNIDEWLTRYKNAECIITNTFHGTVFAIIFRKPFLVLLQTGESAAQNERLYSLLEQFGLLGRIMHRNEAIDMQMNCPIDWEKVSTIQKAQANLSLSILRALLDE